MRKLTRENLAGSKFETFLTTLLGVAVAGAVLYVVELVEVVVISLAIILPIRYFLIQPFYVKGASMEPNFNDHEYLVIDELSYRFREPVRGESVVFRYPADPRQYFIKRVIGLPGETVKIENGIVTIINKEHPEGFELHESYLTNVRTDRSGTTTLGDNQYFMMGDNRPYSLDSRFFGPVNRDALIGRVWIRGWPVYRVQLFNPPTYTE